MVKHLRWSGQEEAGAKRGRSKDYIFGRGFAGSERVEMGGGRMGAGYVIGVLVMGIDLWGYGGKVMRVLALGWERSRGG